MSSLLTPNRPYDTQPAAPVTIPVPVISYNVAQLTGTQFLAWDNVNGRARTEYYRFPGGANRAGTSGADLTASVEQPYTNADITTAHCWAIETVIDCASFEWDYRVQEACQNFRVYINGQLALDSFDSSLIVKDVFDGTTTIALPKIGGARAGTGSGVAGSGTYAVGDHVFFKFAFGKRVKVHVRIESGGRFGMYGLRTDDATGSCTPPFGTNKVKCFGCGDSTWTAQGALNAAGEANSWPWVSTPALACKALGWDFKSLSNGGRGWAKNFSNTVKLCIGDSLLPPKNSWYFTETYTVAPTSFTITYNGQTTGSIAYSATADTRAANINAALATTFGTDAYGRNNVQFGEGYAVDRVTGLKGLFISRLADTNPPSVTFTGGTASWTGFTAWQGDLMQSLTAMGMTRTSRFVVLLAGGGNDLSAGMSNAQIAGAYGDCVDKLKGRIDSAVSGGFPNAVIIATGCLQDKTMLANALGRGTSDNAIYNVLKDKLDKINGVVPFISWHKPVLDTPTSIGTLDVNFDALAGFDFMSAGDGAHLLATGYFRQGYLLATRIGAMFSAVGA